MGNFWEKKNNTKSLFELYKKCIALKSSDNRNESGINEMKLKENRIGVAYLSTFRKCRVINSYSCSPVSPASDEHKHI